MPGDSSCIIIEMNQLIITRSFDEMVNKAQMIIDENPDNNLGYWWKARSLTFLRSNENALRLLIDAMKHAESMEEESKISSSIANVYNIMKNWTESLNYTDIALALNPRNVVAVIARSIALSATGKRKEAQRLLEGNWKLFTEKYQQACAYAVLRNKVKMLETLEGSFIDNPHQRVTVLFDPDFKLFLGDPDFKRLLAP